MTGFCDCGVLTTTYAHGSGRVTCAFCIHNAVAAALRSTPTTERIVEQHHDRHSEPVVACGKCRAGVRG